MTLIKDKSNIQRKNVAKNLVILFSCLVLRQTIYWYRRYIADIYGTQSSGPYCKGTKNNRQVKLIKRVIVMTYRLFMWAFLSVLGISMSFADVIKVSGRVCYVNDSTSVVGATVRLSDHHGAMILGTTTDAEGSFLLTGDTKSAAEKVEVSFVGFTPVSIDIRKGSGDIRIGEIYLVEDRKVLDEVVVSGSLRQINRQLVFPDKLQIRASQDFITLLQNLSLNGLSVDQINKSASIHDKPIHWMINGISHSLEEVRNLKPSSILRIDYSEIPLYAN